MIKKRGMKGSGSRALRESRERKRLGMVIGDQYSVIGKYLKKRKSITTTCSDAINARGRNVPN